MAKGALSWPFLRLYLLTIIYFGANSILNVMIPLQGDSWGASNTEIGIVMGAYLFTTMFFRPWVGRIIHRQGPVRVLRIILVINGLALLLYTFTGLEGYFAARMLQGACTAFFSMALQLGIVDALPEKERSQGISLYSLFASIPTIIGPLLAVGMWRSGDWTWFVVSMIAFAMITNLAGFTVRMNDSEASVTGPSPQTTSFLQDLPQLYRNPHLFKCSLLMLVASIVFGAVTTFIPLYAEEIPSASAAVFLMLQAVTIVAARFFLRKKIPSDGKWHSAYVMVILLNVAAASLCVSLSPSVSGGFVWFYLGGCLMGISQALLYPTLTTYLTFVLPQPSRNVLLGLFLAMADLGVSLGGAAMGPLADFSSYSFLYFICAILGVVMSGFAYYGRQASTSP